MPLPTPTDDGWDPHGLPDIDLAHPAFGRPSNIYWVSISVGARYSIFQRQPSGKWKGGRLNDD